MAEKDIHVAAQHLDSEVISENSNQFVNEDLNDVNLNNNTSAKIKNPLAGLSRDALMRDVEDFANEHQLHDITRLLNKGALVAQTPAEFESVEGLDESEKEALRNEVVHKSVYRELGMHCQPS